MKRSYINDIVWKLSYNIACLSNNALAEGAYRLVCALEDGAFRSFESQVLLHMIHCEIANRKERAAF